MNFEDAQAELNEIKDVILRALRGGEAMMYSEASDHRGDHRAYHSYDPSYTARLYDNADHAREAHDRIAELEMPGTIDEIAPYIDLICKMQSGTPVPGNLIDEFQYKYSRVQEIKVWASEQPEKAKTET